MARTHQGALNGAETRKELLDAGLRIADELGVRGLSVNAIVAAAERSKGAFFHHFDGRDSYLVELHRRLHDTMVAEIAAGWRGLEPGADRLVVVAGVYLDTFRAHRGVRAFFLEARGEPVIQAEIAARNAHAAELIAEDFAALGWDEPEMVARLWIAALAEVGIVEFERRSRDEKARDALLAIALRR